MIRVRDTSIFVTRQSRSYINMCGTYPDDHV